MKNHTNPGNPVNFVLQLVSVPFSVTPHDWQVDADLMANPLAYILNQSSLGVFQEMIKVAKVTLI